MKNQENNNENARNKNVDGAQAPGATEDFL